MAGIIPDKQIIRSGDFSHGADVDLVIGECDFDGTVVEVNLLATVVTTIDASNELDVAVINKGAAGTGTTEVAGDDGIDSVTAFDKKAITLSATAANRNVTAGDVLAIDVDESAGTPDYDGACIEVVIRRR